MVRKNILSKADIIPINMKVEYYFELSYHSIIAVKHFYAFNCHNLI